ncbi:MULTISPECIES: hypothetical protein [unclassified Streptomyces]|uniref:hypothetical protein n=1 Tax=unclassified Streptomyces TaxID=2593676 RepID=UPI0022541D46|nr:MULTISPECIES: hypothetical protein [unclassified Streptomyces]MCX4406016.1 hypothetical protein [Streptomyces sp. NBC_01764]MCX5189460.1 hypothetical protein [Streptomyces sp. NBC_00268]
MVARRAGEAWLVHPVGALDHRSWMYAAGLARDAEFTVVVIDIPEEDSPDLLDAVARALPSGQTGLRLLFGRTPAGGSARAAQWLAARTGRDMVTADGRPWPTAEGALFVSPDRGSGWARYAPTGETRWMGWRFPHPFWESGLGDLPAHISEWTHAEPLAAGLWLRPSEASDALPTHRSFLMTRLRSRPEALTVVVGAPGSLAVPLADVARFWTGLPEHLRPHTRFSCFGPVVLPAGTTFGEALAAAVGATVRSYTGLPVSSTAHIPTEEPVVVVRPDGTLGRTLMAREVAHFPPSQDGGPAYPVVTNHRWPVDTLPLIRPGVYQHGPDAVVEVLSCGLWVRNAVEPVDAEPHSLPMDEANEMVLYDSGDPQTAPSLRELAQDIARRVAADNTVPLQVTGMNSAARRDEPEPFGDIRSTVLDAPDRTGIATARASSEGHEPSRPETARTAPRAVSEHLRALCGEQYDSCIAFAAELVRRHPALRGDQSSGDPVVELAVLRLHLLRDGDLPILLSKAGAGNTAAQELGRLLASGLHRLPAYTGPVALRTELDQSDLARYKAGGTVTASNWFAGTMTGWPGQSGNTDLVILSSGGRRTALLEAGDPDVVMFPPRVRFAPLAVDAGARNAVFLRELGPDEAATADPDACRRAVRQLRRALTGWRRDEGFEVVRTGMLSAFFQPPFPGTTVRPMADGAGASREPNSAVPTNG